MPDFNLDSYLQHSKKVDVSDMDFSQMRQVPRMFLLDDYRERESDFLVEIPFRTAAEAVPLLI